MGIIKLDTVINRFKENYVKLVNGDEDEDLAEDIMFDANYIASQRKEFIGLKVSELYNRLQKEG